MHDGMSHGANYSRVKDKMIKKAQHRPDMKKSEATGYLDEDDKAAIRPGSTVRPSRQRMVEPNVHRLPGQVSEMGGQRKGGYARNMGSDGY